MFEHLHVHAVVAQCGLGGDTKAEHLWKILTIAEMTISNSHRIVPPNPPLLMQQLLTADAALQHTVLEGFHEHSRGLLGAV